MAVWNCAPTLSAVPTSNIAALKEAVGTARKSAPLPTLQPYFGISAQ
jgi:hypothetical protein